jgi:hypothetical protein
MIKEPRLSTVDSPTRYGGLLICGMNYGLARGGNPQEESDFPPWAQYFTHESNRNGDRFVSRLTSWFAWWNISLENPDGTPTELNLAISQTNLFYDSSKSFTARSKPEVELAFSRLQKAVKKLNASGLLLVSTTLAGAARDLFQICEWQSVTAGRFVFYHALTDSLQVAVCPHPRCPQKRSDVESVGRTVRQWIDDIMREYKNRQNQRSERIST